MNTNYPTRHGGPWDRGAADSYYRRPRHPHYYVGATYSTACIEEVDMSLEEIAAYHAGYDDNEAAGHFKDYGQIELKIELWCT